MSVPAVGRKDDGVGHALLHQLQRKQPVVHVGKVGTIHLDHVDLELIAIEVVVQALEKLLGALVKEEGPVDEVDPKHPRGLLLQQGVLLVKTRVEHHRIGFARSGRLKLDAKPTVTLRSLVVVDGGHSVGEREVLLVG